MVFTKAPVAAAVVLLAQICLVEGARYLNITDSPPRTVTAEQGCFTDFGPVSKDSVPTFSRLYSYTFPVTAYSYIIPSTSTITVTPTVSGGGDGGGGDPAITSTSTVTTTTHVSSLYSPSTVTAGPRFTPLASALSRRPVIRQIGEADLSIEDVPNNLVVGIDSYGVSRADPPLYPQAVVCEEIIRVFTTSTSTITASYAATTTTTLLLPSALQNTTAATTTTTETSTITDVVSNPTQTVYQACQADNLVSGHDVPPTYFVEAVHNWYIVREERIVDTAENCCIACQREADCGGSLYHMFSGTCYTFRTGGGGEFREHGRQGGTGERCRAPGELRSSTDFADGAIFVASNGQCSGWWVSDEAPI
ncbi:hypothetical protein CORC01_01943 [Colletotrichum orchidophilum]|uniref:Apple domain-containing protein n=1 Tax=Colletotrichum orchidophilum TaxID=1209926 RepID=A0A1G4BN00_9PEZI|nr:uncharacterized protein CORC01_01943 [Colletotrichum orchidophilum]OHF02842.1 hypothetical protein CORC01_01943 [Colletotrichum orchidophilum]